MIALHTLLRILKKYIGTDRKTIPEFCSYVFSLLMKPPTTEEDEELDAADNYYPFANKKSASAAYYMIRGGKGIPADAVNKVSGHFDKTGMLTAIETLAHDTKLNLLNDLKNECVDCSLDNMNEVCAELFNSYIQAALGQPQSDNFGVIEKRNDIGEIIPPVPIVPVRYRDGKVYTGDSVIELSPYLEPSSEEDDELPYIDALMEVYSEKEKRPINRENTGTLNQFLFKHFGNQKRAYAEAHRLQRRVRESFSDGEEQFATLEDDTYECVEMVYYDDSYGSGFDRLQAVLKQAAVIPAHKSALYNISGLIGGLEQKGICHILVNNGRIKSWVNMYD